MYARLRCGGNLPLCDGLGTRNRLLRYGICVPCSKRLPGVRDAFSEAFGVKNRLLRYGRDIRCAEQPPMVRLASRNDPSGEGTQNGIQNGIQNGTRKSHPESHPKRHLYIRNQGLKLTLNP